MADDGRSVVVWALVGIGLLAAVFIASIVIFPVVGAFALGLDGGESSSTPKVEYTIQADGEATFIHESGDSVTAADVAVLVNGEQVTTWAEAGDTGEKVSAGDQLTISDVQRGDEVLLQWTGEGGPTILVSATVR